MPKPEFRHIRFKNASVIQTSRNYAYADHSLSDYYLHCLNSFLPVLNSGTAW